MIVPVIGLIVVLLAIALLISFFVNRSKNKEENAAQDELDDIVKANKVLDINDKVLAAQVALQKRKDSRA